MKGSREGFGLDTYEWLLAGHKPPARTYHLRSSLNFLSHVGLNFMQRLIDSFHPGQCVFTGGFTGESALLKEELHADPERASGVTFSAVQFPGIDSIDFLAVHPQAKLSAYFMTPAVRAGLRQGRAELFNLDYPGVARHLRDGLTFDVAIAQLTLPDADGYCSAGLAADFMPLVWPRAKRRVAHLNPSLPRTRGSWRVHMSEIEVAVEADAPVLPFTDAPSGDMEAQIGAHVAQLVRDGDTLQFGIGSVPSALGHSLTSHRQLRFYGGMLPSAVRTLWEAGAMDTDASITTGVVLGNSSLHDWAAQLAPLWLTDVTHTHSVAALGAIPRLMAINSALEVDLFGQVNAERAGGVFQAGAGGLPAFAHGALNSPGGHLFICLGATARQGTVARIVPSLGAQGLCTLPRSMADVVVTEHGAAQIRHLSLDARAQALIGIAAPEHRHALANVWDELMRKA